MSAPARHSHASGMTLLELLVVMAVLALLAGLLPMALDRALPARRVAATARALTVQLRELQSQAMRSGRTLRLILQPDGCLIQQPSGESIQLHWPPIEATLDSGEPGPAHTIQMYPDGSSSGGVVELHVGRRHARVSVNALTGLIRCCDA